MEIIELTFLGKSYYFKSDEPEMLELLGEELETELAKMQQKYSEFSREQLFLLYILRRKSEQEVSESKINKREMLPKQDAVTAPPEDEIKESQLNVNLDEIDDILNTDF